MQPQPLSSGNLLADRRYEWARDLVAKGDLAGAADLLTQALELAPDYAVAWFALGELREKQGDRAGAVAAFRKAVASDPGDRHGAGLHLVRLGAPLGEMPRSYVRALFDGYASSFDNAVTEGLNYRAPALLARAVEASGVPMTFGSVLDLGCGTGLAGAAFRPRCDWLVGVDLSKAMLAQARGKGLYDRLVEADIVQFLRDETVAGARYHLVIAADVFMYLADLAPMLKAMAAVLAPGGRMAFSVETYDGEGVVLRDTLRFAHSAAHVRAALAGAGLQPFSLEAATTRTENGVPVPGLVVVAGD